MTTTKPYPMRAFFSRGLGSRLLLILVVGVAATTLCTGAFGYFHANRLRKDGAATAMEHGAEKLAGQIDISLDSAVGLLRQLGNDSRIRSALAGENQKYAGLSRQQISRLIDNDIEIWKASGNLQRRLNALSEKPAGRALAYFVRDNPSFKTLIAVDREGKAVAAAGRLSSLYPEKQKQWLRSKVIGLGRPAISEPIVSGKPASPSVLMCIPIIPGGIGDLKGELLAEYSLAHAATERLVDENEIIAFLLAGDENRSMYILHPPDMASSTPVKFRNVDGGVSSERSGWFSIELERLGINALAGYAGVRGSTSPASVKYTGRRWLVVQATPESYVMGPVNSMFIQSLAFALGVLILISLAGLALAQRILRPIHRLQQGVQEIGQGNLEHRIDVRSGDEIESLAFEFNRMADRMQKTQEQLQRRGKELEQRVNQLRRLQAQLMQSERMAATGELAAQIAHEINNPLGIIKNYVGIAKMLMPDEDSNRENLKIIDQEINRIAGIVRRLLKFAKPGSEDIQSVQVNQTLEELLALLRGQLFRRRIEIDVDLADNLPEVSTSTDQMRQVFLNLIKNAEDAMPDGGKLSVRTRYRKGLIEIEIADTGCGIPPEDAKNIFEPFFTTKGVKGTGLGLSVSYGIIKNYSGEISVESEPGVGTTFTIQLPVVSDKVFQVIQTP